MSGAAKLGLVVLFEDELRKAAKMLEELYTEKDGNLRVQQAARAITACRAALYHLGKDPGTALVLLSSRDVRQGAIVATEVVSSPPLPVTP